MVGNTINYVPTIYQSLRDLVAWVEKGIAPPTSTGYVVNEGQVELAAKAEDRHGIQPVVTLTVRGAKRIEVAANQPVQFTGLIEAPPGAGRIVGAGWWFGEGRPRYEISPIGNPKRAIEINNTHTYKKPGVYYVTLFATAQRKGNASDMMTDIQNLDRVRVVVK
jgi:hypothetical protein